jgi:outer membrane lipoprotein
MKRHGLIRFLAVTGALSLVTGCAYPISQALRDEARPHLTFAMVLENPAAYTGSVVIWGGKIIGAASLVKGGEITLLELPLDRWGRPEDEEPSGGRFIARASTFLDPAVYGRGVEVTVAGKVIGKEVRPVGQTQYTYPVIMIKESRLWRKEPTYVYPPPDYWYWEGYPYPYPYWYGWYGDYGGGDVPSDYDWQGHPYHTDKD